MANFVTRSGNFTNALLLALIAILCAAILLDGILYNKPNTRHLIYPLEQATSVEVLFDDKLLLAFEKSDNRWLQTQPVSAPALSSRVQLLLDTNKQSERQYAVTELPVDDIFKDSVVVKIDKAEFIIGATEPVSNLRYVRTQDKVYLQPDTLLALLKTANSVFIDLQITHEVESVRIGNKTLENSDAWSELSAIAILPTAVTSTNSYIDISIIQVDKKPLQLNATHTEEGYVISNEHGHHYLLHEQTAKSLGLTDLLATDS